jgi:uncharacterized protein YqhQ
MQHPNRHSGLMQLMGKVIKAFALGVLSFVIFCLLLGVFISAAMAGELFLTAVPLIIKLGLTIFYVLAIAIVLESLR